MVLPSFPTDPASGHVLIVDDTPDNLLLLESILRMEGFEISTAIDGEEALRSIVERAPDLVLLDIMMPGMDGHETCRRIRRIAKFAHLPIVMVTAQHKEEARRLAREAGADDFITKPVEIVEVVTRVSSLVRAKRGRDDLERAYADLRRSEGLRDSLTEMLVHDLRTPLTALLVALDMLGGDLAGPLNETQKSLVSMSARGGRNLLGLVNDLLDVARLENGQMNLNLAEFNFTDVVERAVSEVLPLLSDRDVTVEREIAPLPIVKLDANLIGRVLVNLLSNAIKYSPQAGRIVLGAKAEDGLLKVWIRDFGCGITPEQQERIWDKFGQAEARQQSDRHSTGLGLTFCKLVVEEHGGQIGVDSEIGEGSTFSFQLPLSPEENPAL